jgi:AAA family ATP:ADP antiporter
LTPSTAANDAPLPLIGANRRELPAFALSFAYFFCVLSAYYVIRPVREQIGSAAGGTQALPEIWLFVLIAMLALTPVYGWLVTHLPRQRFVPMVYLFFAVGMIAFMPVLAAPHPGTLHAVAFYVWVSVFNLFVVSVFWSYMADIFTDEQARRMFGPIGAGGSLGALLGPLMTQYLVEIFGVPPLLVVSSTLLGLAILCVMLLGRWAAQHGRLDRRIVDAPIGGTLLAGAKLLFKHPFLRNMALLMLLADVVGTALYGMVSDIGRDQFATPEARAEVQAGFDSALAGMPIAVRAAIERLFGTLDFAAMTAAVARTKFFALVDLSTNLLQIFLQVVVARWLMTRFGALPGLLLPAFVNMAILFSLALAPSFGLVVLALIVTRAGAYGLVQPARESLYTRVDRESRYKAKSFIDTAVWRAGDVATSYAQRTLSMMGFGIPFFAAISGTAALVSLIFSYRLVRSSEPDKEPRS